MPLITWGVMQMSCMSADSHEATTGGWINAYAHIVTAVIGSGVLSLAWSMSWLGEHSQACLDNRTSHLPAIRLH